MVQGIWKSVPLFKSYKQQDAHEFILYFLDRLDSEFSKTLPSVVGLLDDKSTFLRDYFETRIVTKTTCLTCSKVV